MINKSILMGRTTTDIEIKKTTGGLSFCRFNVAVERSFKEKDGTKKVDFITVVAWRGTADFISTYFKKGDMIAIEGTIQTGNYTDQEGKKRYTFEVLADNVSFCGSKSDNTGSHQATNSSNGTVLSPSATFEEIPDLDDEDLPFF